MENNFYSQKATSLQGKEVDMAKYKGKVVLVVNTASKCGFTPQYNELQKLHETYKDILAIIGVPCNQFGSQEPGRPFEIQEFCEVNYGVNFLITEKIDVIGNKQHELYKWLTDKNLNDLRNSTVKWNFQKYLINTEGKLVDYFYSTTKPLSNKITKHL